MASISISDLYRGEGPGEKYGGILSAVLHEIIRNGIPEGCDERTWTEQLIVKHTFLIAKQMADQQAAEAPGESRRKEAQGLEHRRFQRKGLPALRR